MTGLNATALRALRNRFGDLAEPIITLRDAGKTVRPFGDRFAVDEQMVDADDLQRLANAVEARRKAKPPRKIQKPEGLGNPPAGKSAGTTDRADGPGSALADPLAGGTFVVGSTTELQGPMANAGDGGETAATRCRPSPTLSKTETVPASLSTGNEGGSHDAGLITRKPEVARPATPATVLCGCGKPKSPPHGRCWSVRGWPGPVVPKPRGKHPVRVCEGCQGTLTYWARGKLCRKCHQAKVTKPKPNKVARDANNAAIWAEIDALKSTVERIRAQLAMEQGR